MRYKRPKRIQAAPRIIPVELGTGVFIRIEALTGVGSGLLPTVGHIKIGDRG